LKGYSRNKGGTEYQMYSPLTLFADACTADASAALAFDTAVENYLANSNPATKNKLIEFFEKWILIDKQLLELSTDALLIQPILPLSKSLSAVSIQFLRVLDDKQAPDLILMQALLVKCNSKEQADVELAVSASLKRLLDSLK
jgi:hexosaminidase